MTLVIDEPLDVSPAEPVEALAPVDGHAQR
jgi:hypothetical protein